MSNYIYVDQINLEYALTASFADLPINQGTNTPSIDETIVRVAHIYVDFVNLEVPITVVAAEIITNTGSGTQTILEEITGTPIPEPVIPIGGGVGQRIRSLGGRPYLTEELIVSANSVHEIEETVHVTEMVESVAITSNSLATVVRKPVYKKQTVMQVLNYRMAKDKSLILDPVESVPIENTRKREEEELLLLGIM